LFDYLGEIAVHLMLYFEHQITSFTAIPLPYKDSLEDFPEKQSY
jgi:hypothetical protein